MKKREKRKQTKKEKKNFSNFKLKIQNKLNNHCKIKFRKFSKSKAIMSLINCIWNLFFFVS